MRNIFTLFFFLGAHLIFSSFLWGSSNLQNVKSFVTKLDKLNNPSLSCMSKEPDPEIRKWEEAGYGNPVITYLDDLYPNNDQREYTHQVKLDIVLVRESDWTIENIKQNYKKVADIYADCGVKFSNVRAITVDSPQKREEFVPGFNDNSPSTTSSNQFAERIPNNRITSIHVRYLSTGGTGTSYSSKRCIETTGNHNHPLLNKQWVSDYVLTENYKNNPIGHIPVEAHELAHILLDFPFHYKNKKDNLMSNPFDSRGSPLRGSDLTSDQCDTIKKHKLVTKIDPT